MILSMRLGGILERIEARLTKLDMTASEAGRLAGKKYAIYNIRRAVKAGNREGVSTATIEALAPVLKTTRGWLMSAEGPEELAEVIALDETLTVAEAVRAFALALEELAIALPGEATVLARAVIREMRRPPGLGESPPTEEEQRSRVREAIRLFR